MIKERNFFFFYSKKKKITQEMSDPHFFTNASMRGHSIMANVVDVRNACTTKESASCDFCIMSLLENTTLLPK